MQIDEAIALTFMKGGDGSLEADLTAQSEVKEILGKHYLFQIRGV